MRRSFRGVLAILGILCLMGCSSGDESLSEMGGLEELEKISRESIMESGTTALSGLDDVPEEYLELFEDVEFVGNMVWASNKTEYTELIEKLKETCKKKFRRKYDFCN